MGDKTTTASDAWLEHCKECYQCEIKRIQGNARLSECVKGNQLLDELERAIAEEWN